uniref:uncharacterized protein n=1 Tax=Myxine glutinosa TaxID=7769 RepID=UPI00358DE0E5
MFCGQSDCASNDHRSLKTKRCIIISSNIFHMVWKIRIGAAVGSLQKEFLKKKKKMSGFWQVMKNGSGRSHLLLQEELESPSPKKTVAPANKGERSKRRPLAMLQNIPGGIVSARKGVAGKIGTARGSAIQSVCESRPGNGDHCRRASSPQGMTQKNRSSSGGAQWRTFRRWVQAESPPGRLRSQRTSAKRSLYSSPVALDRGARTRSLRRIGSLGCKAFRRERETAPNKQHDLNSSDDAMDLTGSEWVSLVIPE